MIRTFLHLNFKWYGSVLKLHHSVFNAKFSNLELGEVEVERGKMEELSKKSKRKREKEGGELRTIKSSSVSQKKTQPKRGFEEEEDSIYFDKLENELEKMEKKRQSKGKKDILDTYSNVSEFQGTLSQLPNEEKCKKFVCFLEDNKEILNSDSIYMKIFYFKKQIALPKYSENLLSKQSLEKMLKKGLKNNHCFTVENGTFHCFVDQIDFQDFIDEETIHEIKEEYRVIENSLRDKSDSISKENGFMDVINQSLNSSTNVKEMEQIRLSMYDYYRTNLKVLFSNPSKNEISRWVYAYSFPYDFDEKEVIKDLKSIVNKYDEIEQVIPVKYKHFKKMPVLNSYELSQKSKNEFLEFVKTKITQNYEIEENEMDSGEEKDKDSLIGHLLKENYSKNKKSYVLIKLRTEKGKRELLHPDFQIFGISKNKNQIRFVDADFKNTLIVKNIDPKMSARDLLGVLNSHFANTGNETFQTGNLNPNKSLETMMVYLTFSSFENSLKALHTINQIKIGDKLLSAIHTYGGVIRGNDNLTQSNQLDYENFSKNFIKNNLYLSELIALGKVSDASGLFVSEGSVQGLRYDMNNFIIHN